MQITWQAGTNRIVKQNKKSVFLSADLIPWGELLEVGTLQFGDYCNYAHQNRSFYGIVLKNKVKGDT